MPHGHCMEVIRLAYALSLVVWNSFSREFFTLLISTDLPTVRQFLLKQAKLKYFTFGQFKLTKTRIDTVKVLYAATT